MATSTEQLTDLIQSGNLWKAAADDMLAERNAALNAHRNGYETLASDLTDDLTGLFYGWLFVDQISGDDTNDGSRDAPVQTVKQAAKILPNGTTSLIHIIGDYQFTAKEFIPRGYYVITSEDTDNRTTLTFAPQIDGADIEAPGITMNEAMSELHFQKINLHLDPVAAHVTRPWSISTKGSTAIYFQNVAITTAPGNDRVLLENNGVAILSVKATTYPAEMAGHWMVGVTAGTLATAEARLLTTLDTL